MRNFTKKEITKLKIYWDCLRNAQDVDFLVPMLEKRMCEDLKIDTLEFIRIDGCYCGIGNTTRTINLIQEDELEK